MDDNHIPTSDSDQSRAPLIVVTEALPSEETAQDTNVNVYIKTNIFFSNVYTKT